MFVQSRITRKILLAAYHQYASACVFYPGPRTLIISIPKAGTHMLTATLNSFPKLMSSQRHIRMPDVADIEKTLLNEDEFFVPDVVKLKAALNKIRKGQFGSAHFFYNRDVEGVLKNLDFKIIFVIRDPRDIVVSQYKYISNLKRHPYHDFFLEQLKTPEAQLRACIEGIKGADVYRKNNGLKFMSNDFAGIADKLRAYGGWLDSPIVQTVSFEKLRGLAGGGDDATRIEGFNSIAKHINREMPEERLIKLLGASKTTKSATFRKGTIGEWRKYFKEEHVELFKELGGDLLIEYGYESNLNW